MVDIALSQDHIVSADSARLRRSHRADGIFRRVTQLCALLVLLMFIGIIWTLVQHSLPSIRAFGLSFV